MKIPASQLVNRSTVGYVTITVRCSRHAKVRQQQRGIETSVLDCLLAYGRRQYNHDHCEIVYFDSRSIDRIQMYEGKVTARLAMDHRDVYAVVDCDGCVVTTGHRYKRIQRDRRNANLRKSRKLLLY